jgi:hypothetical protein
MDNKKPKLANPTQKPSETPNPKQNDKPKSPTQPSSHDAITPQYKEPGESEEHDDKMKTEDQIGSDADDVPGQEPKHAADNMTTMYKKRNRIDYASTVEDAYGDLNKILGGDGIKRLTEDTQKLMGQQMQLADAMKSMTPLLKQAKSLMAGFDMKQFGDITAMAKQFGAGNE